MSAVGVAQPTACLEYANQNMLLDEFLPTYDVHARYQALFPAPPERVHPLILDLDWSQSPLVRWLVLLRGLGSAKVKLTQANPPGSGFTLLGEEPGRELVVGMAGRLLAAHGRAAAGEPGRVRGFHAPRLCQDGHELPDRAQARRRLYFKHRNQWCCAWAPGHSATSVCTGASSGPSAA